MQGERNGHNNLKTILNEDKTTQKVSLKRASHSSKKIKFFQLCVWIFGCVLGFAVEVVYAYFKHGRYINKQGMIYGPFNQVYGLGAVVFTICLYKFRECKRYIIFLAGAIIGGAFEFVCSFLQEIIFKSASWHYSKFPFSLNGRTNPIHAMFWGILGVIFFGAIFPYFVNLMDKVPSYIRTPLTWFVFVFMVLNLTISACAVYRQSQRLEKQEADNAFEVFLDKHYDDQTLKKIYPNMKFILEEDR